MIRIVHLIKSILNENILTETNTTTTTDDVNNVDLIEKATSSYCCHGWFHPFVPFLHFAIQKENRKTNSNIYLMCVRVGFLLLLLLLFGPHAYVRQLDTLIYLNITFSIQENEAHTKKEKTLRAHAHIIERKQIQISYFFFHSFS